MSRENENRISSVQRSTSVFLMENILLTTQLKKDSLILSLILQTLTIISLSLLCTLRLLRVFNTVIKTTTLSIYSKMFINSYPLPWWLQYSPKLFITLYGNVLHEQQISIFDWFAQFVHVASCSGIYMKQYEPYIWTGIKNCSNKN